MKEKYKDIALVGKTMALINHANAILDEYAKQGFTMTLRQLYYQFVARDLFANNYDNYKRIGRAVRDGRLTGLIDWDAIEDRTRSLNRHASWDKPADIISASARQYREDLWKGQRYRPEVWIEKEALSGVIKPICDEYRVPYFAAGGNDSTTDMREAGERFAGHLEAGAIPLVLHLGDHDPNGLDMTRDNRERLSLFARGDIEVRRIALNMAQVRRYNPPTNFSKETDPHYPAYVAQYGEACWELDALPPPVLTGLIRDELDLLIDVAKRGKCEAAERRNRTLLGKVAANWPMVQKAVGA